MPSGGRLAAIVVGVLLVAGAIFLALNVLGRPGGPAGSTGQSPSDVASCETATGSAPASPVASDPPAASAPSDPQALAVLEEIEAQVEAIRGLEPAEIGPPDLITREELRGELRTIFDEEYPCDERERDNRALRAFGLLGEDEDMADLQLDLLGEGVLGFYDDIDRRMVVVSDAGLDAVAKLTYAHEYTHALQDAAFGLATLETDAVGEDDRGLARTALIEGDANATMLAWAFAHLTQAEILELQEMPVPDTAGVPSWMVAQLEFPYTAGQAWIGHLAGPDITAPDFSAVDAAFAEPPASTEQIIDFDAWDQREAPVPVELPDLVTALGNGWEEIDSSPVGQATIEIILEFFDAESDASEAARGWGGDPATVVGNDAGDFVLAWRLAWDGPADATEFITAYEAVVPTLDFEASVRQLSNGDVLVVHASNRAAHDLTVSTVGD